MGAADESQQDGDLVEQRLRELEELLEQRESELEARDRTVQELTDRLSQAVERLDRVKRAGSDQNVIRTSTFPKEVVDQQCELVEDLQRAVEMWTNMQMSCAIGRFEMQISDLHALFDEHFRPPEPEPEPEPEAATEDAEISEGTSDEDPSEAESREDSDETGTESVAEDADLFAEFEEKCPLRPPEILNLTEADEVSLRRCVEQQDEYIDYLSARLQWVAEKKTAVDWEELAKSPEKIQRQLEHTVAKIQQSKHLAEFELALQRTRLKRKERDLKLLSGELEVQMQNVDWGKGPAPQEEPAKGQRWLRMLGVNKNE